MAFLISPGGAVILMTPEEKEAKRIADIQEREKKRRIEHDNQAREFMRTLKRSKSDKSKLKDSQSEKSKSKKSKVVESKATGSKDDETKEGKEAATCPICTEKYSFRHKRLECPYSCGGEACTSCHTRYLQSATTDFHCMKCRREWKLQFMKVHFSEKQLHLLYKQYQKVLLARDEANLPMAQQVLEDEREEHEINYQIQQLEIKIQQLRERRNALIRGRRTKLEKDSKDGPPIKCPTSECRGYLRGGICGVCERRYCLKCMGRVLRPKRSNKVKSGKDCEEEDAEEEEYDDKIKDDEQGLQRLKDHVCDKDALANMEYLRSNSKACPKCGIWTSRTEGCDQMWCINCHVAWNWSTGKEATGVIHNPHYTEWQLRTRGHVERNPLDVMCGGLPVYFSPFEFREDHMFLTKVLRRVHEIHDSRIVRGQPRERTNLDLQLKYLRNEMDKDAWSATLFRRYKTFKYHEQYFNIHQMFHLAVTDILQRRYNKVIDAVQAAQELNALRIYYNQELLETVRINKSRHQRFYNLISDKWDMVTWTDKDTVDKAIAAKI